jgi:hypothetical protein
LCFVVLGVTGTEGQETERFLGARKSARLLVGWEDSLFHSGQAGKECLEAPRTTLQLDELRQTKEEVFFGGIFVIDILYILLF